MISKILLTSFILYSSAVFAAPLKVLTTTTDLQAVVAEIGGANVTVEAFCKGAQDPHFLEAKPSFMVKTSTADLVVAIGLGLEVGWLPNILTGARNAKVMPGQNGYLEAGSLVDVNEKPTGAVSRDQGDVHPEGNPHITLDPIRLGQIAQGIATRLGVLDPSHAVEFKTKADALAKRLETKTKGWSERIAKTGNRKVITYHKTLNYFLSRFGMEAVGSLEPLPGIPPTAKHIVSVIETAKSKQVKLVMVENFFDSTIAQRIAKEVHGLRIVSVPVAVDGDENAKTVDDLYERLVLAVEGPST
jgi:zinc/manganese transport system substrate-binding protein